jgi:hypothetical protein
MGITVRERGRCAIGGYLVDGERQNRGGDGERRAECRFGFVGRGQGRVVKRQPSLGQPSVVRQQRGLEETGGRGMEHLLTVYEVAEALGVSRAKVDELIRTDKLASVQVAHEPRAWTQTLGELVRDAEAYSRAADAVFNAVRAWRDTENAGRRDTPASRRALQRLRDTVDIARAGGVL